MPALREQAGGIGGDDRDALGNPRFRKSDELRAIDLADSVWVGSTQFELWRRDPLPIAVYEDASLARRSAIESLAQQGRRRKVVYNSSSLTGQIAAVDSGLAVAVLTQCSAPAHLQLLGSEQGLGPLEPMEVAVYRSRESRGAKAVDSLHALLIKTLRLSHSG